MAQHSQDDRSGLLAELMKNLQLAWNLMMDPRVSMMTKVLVPILAVGYFILPIDLLPDVVPILGQLDDVAVLLLLMRLFISLAPPNIVAEHKARSSGQGRSAEFGTNDRSSQGDSDNVVDAEYRVVNDG